MSLYDNDILTEMLLKYLVVLRNDVNHFCNSKYMDNSFLVKLFTCILEPKTSKNDGIHSWLINLIPKNLTNRIYVQTYPKPNKMFIKEHKWEVFKAWVTNWRSTKCFKTRNVAIEADCVLNEF